jgi:hypothetical protein
MKKLLLIFGILFLCGQAWASNSAVMYGQTVSAWSAVSITTNVTTQPLCRAIWIGTTQSDDFYINGAWVTFQGATAGTLLPIQATGARITSGTANPNAGDVVFLY